jgi:hypothetical protein
VLPYIPLLLQCHKHPRYVAIHFVVTMPHAFSLCCCMLLCRYNATRLHIVLLDVALSLQRHTPPHCVARCCFVVTTPHASILCCYMLLCRYNATRLHIVLLYVPLSLRHTPSSLVANCSGVVVLLHVPVFLQRHKFPRCVAVCHVAVTTPHDSTLLCRSNSVVFHVVLLCPVAVTTPQAS